MKQHQEPQKSQPKCQLPHCQVLGNNRETPRGHLKRRSHPAVGNAACYKTVIGNRQQPLLEDPVCICALVGGRKRSHEGCSSADRTAKLILQQCWYGVNSRKTNFVGHRKTSVIKFKLFGQQKWQIFIMFNRSRSSLFSSNFVHMFP